jgi:hypothetical protein
MVSGYSRVFYLTHIEIPNFRHLLVFPCVFFKNRQRKVNFPIHVFANTNRETNTGKIRFPALCHGVETNQKERRPYAMSCYWRRRCGLAALDFVVRGMVVITWYILG